MSGATGRRWMLAVGGVTLVGLLALSIALWFAGGQRRDDNVQNFARAPVGCDTTLDFDRAGRYVFHLETTGELDGLAGECEAARTYDSNPDNVEPPDLVLTDPEGNELELTAADPQSYDTGTFVGESLSVVDVATAGDHVVRVPPTNGEPFAIAVGRAVDDGVAPLRWGAVAAAITALVVGGLLLVLGSRRGGPEPEHDTPWQPDGSVAWPSSPPGFPAPPPTTGATGPAGPPLQPGPPTGPPPTWGPPSVG